MLLNSNTTLSCEPGGSLVCNVSSKPVTDDHDGGRIRLALSYTDGN